MINYSPQHQPPPPHMQPGYGPQGYPMPGPGAPFQPQAPKPRGNPGVGILVALITALVGAVLYGILLSAVDAQVGYAAVGLGALVGFLAAKTGGSNPAVWIAAALLSLAAVYLGQLYGLCYELTEDPADAAELLFENFGALSEGWSKEAEPLDWLFVALGGFGAFSAAKKTG